MPCMPISFAVTRVSSQAMAVALVRVSSARNVMSAAFPMGVATT